MAAEWQQLAQSVLLGLIFSYLLAKLFAVIFAFRDDNLRITRADSEPEPETENRDADASARNSDEGEPLIRGGRVSGNESVVTSDHSDSDDDWEGVESTELDEIFSAATAFVAATAADRAALKVSNTVQLQLYALYKIATEGPCSAPQPSALKMTARAKWQAWQKLGAMPAEDAMAQYIDIVSELYPTWASGLASQNRRNESTSDASMGGAGGPMGPVFSTFVYEEESGTDLKLDAIHGFAREGDEENLIKSIESGVPLNLKDSEGRTPLHWAVDRGHLNITELLLNKKADVNAKDGEGQTPLHYAAVCERTAIAELLVKHGGDIELKDDEGNAPRDLCESRWSGVDLVTHGAD